ncbi:hypothetical protein HYT01_01025 [Candidatus Giovannonibacteria bacterium]|nr:hypothetical protein [Candidatus Giovannonibacteria bacterium]
MKKLFLAPFLFFILSGCSYAMGSPLFRRAPFPTPHNIAQKVANEAVKKADVVSVLGAGTSYERKRYLYRFVSHFDLYEVGVEVYNRGKKTLTIDFFYTNRDFSKPENAHDPFGQNFLTLLEQHISDDSVDAEFNKYQKFMKPGLTSLEPFTRAQRDDPGFGVIEYYTDGDWESTKGQWNPVSREQKKFVNDDYNWHLKRIADFLGIDPGAN